MVDAAAATEADFEAGRVGCQRCGLCLWGCAWDAIYRSTRTMASLRETAGFAYRPGHLVRRIEETAEGSWVDAGERLGPYEAVFLAAGVLGSLRVAADSVGVYGIRRRMLDNDMYLVPSVRAAATRPGDGGAFALSEAVLAFGGERFDAAPIHIQLYSYGEFLSRGLASQLPAGLQGAAAALLGRLLVAFVYLHGEDSVRAIATVEQGTEGSRIRMETTPGPRSREIVLQVLRLLRRNRRAFGFYPLPFAELSSGVGFSGHLCGGLPMRAEPAALETHVDGRLADTKALYVVDASTFPMLPAQNLTYTAMANAHRIATQYARRVRAA